VRPSTFVYLYARRLHAYPLREILAGLGVAVGVALVFSVEVANHSIEGSGAQITGALAGSAQLQVQSRTPEGMPEDQAFASLPGVEYATGVVEGSVSVEKGGRLVATQLLGPGVTAGEINSIAAQIPPTSNGVLLPVELAKDLHVPRGQPATVTLLADGRAIRAPVRGVLGPETIGPLARSTIVLAPLAYAQAVLGLRGRVTSVLLRAKPGRERELARALQRAAGGTMDVTAATVNDGLLRHALQPQDQATSFFALIGALIGSLLVVTAMLLTAAERRRMLADLRLQGFARRQLARIVLSQAAVLGLVASALGVLGGYVLASGAWRSNPAYLAGAFPLGTQTVLPVRLALGVWAAGVLLTCAAVSPVLLDLRRDQGDSRGEAIPTSVRGWMLGGSLFLVALSAAASIAPPSTALVAALLLVVALLLAAPAWWAAVIPVAEALGNVRSLQLLAVATRSVRSAPVRSVALAATASLGVFGAVAAGNAHRDLLRGLEHGYAQYVSSADTWVTNKGDDLATSTFPATLLEHAIREAPGVTAVRPYYGGWVDMAGRRVWLIARSSPAIVPSGQVLRGNAARANRLLHQGGWVALSDQLARATDTPIGGKVQLPTPSGPRVFRLAATTTNLGWSSGVLFLPAAAYQQAWGDVSPSALEVEGGSVQQVRRLAPPGLSVQTSAQRASAADALPRQGLERLSEISLLLLIASAAATAIAMGAAIWQRRSTLASLRLQAFKPQQILAILAWETVLVVGAGAVLGCAAGVYGHALADRYLQVSTGYPITFALDIPQILGAAVLVLAAAVAVLLAPGYAASRVPPGAALDGG
jgi:putative ABC transport system permease protein